MCSQVNAKYSKPRASCRTDHMHASHHVSCSCVLHSASTGCTAQRRSKNSGSVERYNQRYNQPTDDAWATQIFSQTDRISRNLRHPRTICAAFCRVQQYQFCPELLFATRAKSSCTNEIFFVDLCRLGTKRLVTCSCTTMCRITSLLVACLTFALLCRVSRGGRARRALLWFGGGGACSLSAGTRGTGPRGTGPLWRLGCSGWRRRRTRSGLRGSGND